jgi:hypothetical protein
MENRQSETLIRRCENAETALDGEGTYNLNWLNGIGCYNVDWLQLEDIIECSVLC